MTRLITEWVETIEDGLTGWSRQLKETTGYDLREIACRAAGTTADAAEGKKAAVIPVTCGEGVIGEFARSVQAILTGIGLEAFVTESTDVAGLYEGVQAGADVAFLADDDRYIALNLKNGATGENDLCTALGYRQVLEDCCRARTGKGLEGEPVLLMGYGRVGRIMYELLCDRGARVTVYDKAPEKQKELEDRKIPRIEDVDQIAGFQRVIDLTCEGGWLTGRCLHEDVVMAAPGVPLSLSGDDALKLTGRLFHDNLEIGTAVMAMEALKVEPPQGGT